MTHLLRSIAKPFIPYSSPVFLVFISLCSVLISCGEKEDPLPEDFVQVKGIQLIPNDSIFLFNSGEKMLRVTPQFIGAFGDEVYIDQIPSLQLLIDGKKSENPARISTDRVGEYEVIGRIGKISSSPLKIKVVDVDPNTFVSRIEVEMADSTQSPYAIAGKSQVDFEVKVLNYQGRPFPIQYQPDFKFYLNGVPQENLRRVLVTESGDLPFWAEVNGMKSEVKILHSRAMPDLSEIYYLPVVFHVVHRGEAVGTAENPGQASLRQLLDETNEVLMGKPSVFRKSHNQLDPKFQFYPATTGPDGTPLEEEGINRIDAEKGVFPFRDENTYAFLFEQMWNPWEYVNIFVMNISGAGGYAFYPPGYESSNPLTSFYGFVINKRLSTKTMIHEAGHFLGLRHTFVIDTDLCEDGDRLPDTEFYNEDRKIFDEQMIQNCEGEFFYASNFMDYRPSARNSFTLDQVNKIRGALEQGNFLPVESSPVARIKPRPWKKGRFDPTVKPVK